MDAAQPTYIRTRVQTACDSCKARKVKCDGKRPCGYCTRRQRPETCHYSPQQRRRAATAAAARSPPQQLPNSQHTPLTSAQPHGTALTPAASVSSSRTPDGHQQDSIQVANRIPGDPDDETEVPREARLLCDAQGKLIFIGDCAPLSFFQSVRQLVVSRVDQDAFAPQSSRYSVLENAPSAYHGSSGDSPPTVSVETIERTVSVYLSTTAGLVDLFDNSRLVDDITLWASHGDSLDDASSAVNYLVLAIGYQKDSEEMAQAYFEYARDRAFANLDGNLSMSTVQAFVLVTLYMLGACQINGAFIFFGLSVRSAFSIGLHRTEVNSRFGHDVHRHRDRLWRSLRSVDLFLSTSMGRPPSTSDIDCTVPYRTVDADGHESFDLLSASVQIFLIIEGIVVEVYSRRKISLAMTEGISRQLRDWSGRWLEQLKHVLATNGGEQSTAQLHGVCQVLSTYYYAVMLVSRPFLMYEVCRRLSDGPPSSSRSDVYCGKSRLADACIDAASLMVDLVSDLIERDVLAGKKPLIVSWLFASSMALGVGLLGGFGRILERYTRKSIEALEHFAKSDAHAMQYSLIAKSLLASALSYLEKKEIIERLQRTESSSQLFGLTPLETPRPSIDLTRKEGSWVIETPSMIPGRRDSWSRHDNFFGRGSHFADSPGRFGDLDPAFLSLSGSLPRTPDLSFLNNALENDQSSGALNLFPLLETSGHIDLAHYL
ncbi:fungal-specific transcription factor domain-containing protein [Pseudomassariella vexata]|uniref:Fungal-specific transcription factor domain-containing protein n=1 Tax=Pseudomassariella vexata TaxID=1141098 RepID=A0A1Y2DE87_9PEZI|nr:fungal-specific transcription factor domain-containing protein [Pseudomassariella vexata]ORY57436.1 fungal-specific transcription factor domain-containing protein [Pseudomassariella vexata]